MANAHTLELYTLTKSYEICRGGIYIILNIIFINYIHIIGPSVRGAPPPPFLNYGPADNKYNFYLIYMLSSNRFHNFWLERQGV